MEILQGPPLENYKFGKDYIPCRFLPMSFLHQIIYILWFFFSAQMVATELLCSFLEEQVKYWGQVEHSQIRRTSEGSGFGCVFVWGKSWSLHTATTVRHKQAWGSEPCHVCAAFPTTSCRESDRKKKRYSIVIPFIRNLSSWFYSSYCKFCQKSNCSD